MLPFMQLLAAIVIDDELRALMGTAIMTAADVNVWVEYLDELEKALDRGVTDEVTYIQEPAEEGEEGDDENTEFPPPPLPSERQCSCDNARDESERYANDWPRELIESAYAAGTSPFKQYLKDLVTKGVLRRGEDATALIALVRTMPEGMKYSKKVIDAVAKVIEIGGAELGHSVAKFKKLSTATHGMTPAKLVDIINAIDLSKMGDEAKVGLQKVLKELSESDNKAIGAAFQLHAIKELQEKGYKITKIEPWTEMKAGNRYVDIVAEIGGETVRIETKSWDPAYVDKYIKKYLHGDGLNPQLYIDLVQKQQQGGKGIKWLLNAEVPAETARKAAYDTIVGNHDLLQKFKNQFGMDEIADVKDEIGRLLTDLFENVG